MPMYAYSGFGGNGKPVKGVKDAESPKVLRQLLRKDGIVVTDVSLSKGGKSEAKGSGLGREVKLGEVLQRVSKTDVAAMTRQMATLIRAGIPLAESLSVLFEQIENVKFKAIVGEVRTEVNEGSSLADSLAKHPRVFDELYVSMVRAGETAGNLDEVLNRLADFMESSQKLKSKVQGAMVYPVIMILVGAAIVLILMVAVVPRITNLFTAQGKALPWNTVLLIWISDTVMNYWWAIAMGWSLAGYIFVKWKNTENGKVTWHRFLLRVPVVGPLIRQISIGRFCRTLGTMLSSGVPMLRALKISQEVMGNVVLRKAVEEAGVAVSQGESLAITLRKSGHFPPAVTHMIAVGERAGELETMLTRIAETYEGEVDMKLTRLTSLIEPLMLVTMGVAVAFIVFSILMPIMDMSKFSR